MDVLLHRPALSRAGVVAFDLESVALVYVALPSVLFLGRWIAWPLGPVAAVALLGCALSLVHRERRAADREGIGILWVVVATIAALWAVLGGIGHFVYANTDWLVRDGVLVDLVRDPWPVVYDIDGAAMLLHAPIGYFLPAALVGKGYGVVAAEYALLAWTVLGVALTFALMLRDRPPAAAALVRVVVFVMFSGMDIVGTITHFRPWDLGQHLEWWAFMFQYSSMTTQLFWVPNHALPGWIAIAWLVTQDPRRLPIGTAILFVTCTPLWAPLTAIGLAPIVAGAIAMRIAHDPASSTSSSSLRRLLDLRLLVPVVATLVLVCPYLVLGTGTIVSEWTMNMRWVGEEFAARYVEFVVLEFVGFAVLLLRRDPRDVLLWIATLILLALPFYRYGVANDLAMRASIPPLALLAIRLGQWLSTPFPRREAMSRTIAIVLLGIGAVTPFMELARAFVEPRWPMNVEASVIDEIRGVHYITPFAQPWIERFMRHPDR